MTFYLKGTYPIYNLPFKPLYDQCCGKYRRFLAWKVFNPKNESEMASHFIKKLQLKIINFKREDRCFINSWSDRAFEGTVKLWIWSMKGESHKIINFERVEDGYFINPWSDRVFKGTVKLWIWSMKGKSHKIMFTVPIMR